MENKILYSLIVIFCLTSCATETINVSPATTNLSAALSNNGISSNTYTDRIDDIGYASEITNLSASLPKFADNKTNHEISKFKYILKEYIGGLEAQNKMGMKRAYQDYEKSYKKLQILKSKLQPDEADILNRYLVRIKTNMGNLQEKSIHQPNTAH